MKKLLNLLVALFVILSLSACMDDTVAVGTDTNQTVSKTAHTTSTTETTTKQTTTTTEKSTSKLTTTTTKTTESTTTTTTFRTTTSTKPTTASNHQEPSSHTVYITKTGKKYHCTKECPGLSNAKEIFESTLSEALNKNLGPCSKCY